jgi:aryl-phospho-beta-D-glucosidase BglC (GH1 family)
MSDTLLLRSALVALPWLLTACGGGSTSSSTATGTAVSASGTVANSTPGSSVSATATTVIATPASSLSLRVSGNRLVNGSGQTVQLRGVNISSPEFASVQGDATPWDGDGLGGEPDFGIIKSWGTNAVRIPLNEASWLGLTCNDTEGNSLHADPSANYQSIIIQTVKDATAAGLYVILDLHWAAPGSSCPLLQTQMADSDHSLSFWTTMASTFKSDSNVLFELFNEPYFNFDFSGDVWSYLMSGGGGSFSGYPAQSANGDWQNIGASWAIASMQAMINTVRSTGASNVVLIGSDGYTQDLSGWLANKPSDPAGQMAATWHAYPTWNAVPGSADDALPNFGAQAYGWAGAILAAGYPVVITEFGGHNSPGTVGAPMAQRLLTWADQQGASYFGWTWDNWGVTENLLIKDAAGTPTDGFGVYVKSHYTCAATGSSNCP